MPLQILVGCFWAAILLYSIVGLAQPRAMLAVLVLQVIYKALFLALLIVPLVLRDGLGATPGWRSLPSWCFGRCCCG